MAAMIIKDKSFMKNMLILAIPISLQSLIQSSLGMIDQVMIGQLGEKSVAGVGLGGRIPFMFFMVIAGVTTGTSIYTSQYWGKKDTGPIEQVISATLTLCMLVAAVFISLSLFIPSHVVGLFSRDYAVISQGASYLRIVSLSFLPVLITMTYCAVLRSTHHVRLPLYAGLISVVINTLLNYALIFGHFKLPALGIEGAAIATTISKVIECVVIIAVVTMKRLPGCISIPKLFTVNISFLRLFMLTTLPLLINEFLWSLGESIYAGIYGLMGTEQATSMIITYPLQGFCISIFIGVSSASGVMLGNKLGEGQYGKSYEYAKKFVVIGMVGAIVAGAFVIVISQLYISTYNVSEVVQRYSTTLTMIFGILLFVKVANMIIGGILRSGGQTKLTLFIDLLGTWGIGIPIGLAAAFVLKLPIHLVYILISLEEIVRLLVGLICIKRKVWIKNIVNEMPEAI